MIDQLKYTRDNLIKQIQTWKRLIKPLHRKYVPLYLRHRHNVNQAKLTDVMVLALLCWQVELNMTVQTRFYHFILNEIFNQNELPERSKFNRICNQDDLMLKIIRYHLVYDKVTTPQYTIIDSLPMPLCAPIRNLRATILGRYANIGFNSTKQLHYYNFKGNFEASDQGIIVAYNITKASMHDIKSVKTLINEYPCKRILADQGYLSESLKQNLARYGIWFWTLKRSNMTPYRYNDQLLKRLRRSIETVFSKLEALFNIEHNNAKSLKGFNDKLEQCLLVDTIKKLN